MTKTERESIINKNILNLQNCVTALLLIKEGKRSEADILRSLNINQAAFRRLLYRDDLSGYEEIKFSEYDNEELKNLTLSGGERIFKKLFPDKRMPVDIEKTVNHNIKKDLSNIEKKVLRMRYYEEMTLSEVSEKLGKSIERVRQIEHKAFRRLRRPSISKMMIYGMSYYEEEKNSRYESELADYKYLVSKNKELLSQINDSKKLNSELINKIKAIDTKKDESVLAITKIDSLPLTVRTYNCLVRGGIKSVEDLMQTSYHRLLKVRNLGRRSFEEIADVMKEKYNWDVINQKYFE